MFRIPGITTENSWEPEPLDEEIIRRKAKIVAYKYVHMHDKNFWGDLCAVILKNKRFMELIIYNINLRISVLRFIIAADYYWTWKEVENFINLLQEVEGFIAYDMDCFEELFQRYSFLYPEWNLQFKRNCPFQLLDHIRSCIQSGSVKEKLYKSGLDVLAFNITEIEEYNMVGSTPSEIFSGLNMRTLRALNSSAGSILMNTEEKRQILLKLQRRHSWMFEKEWNKAVCLYMNEMIERTKSEDILSCKFRAHYKKLEAWYIIGQDKVYVEYVRMQDAISKKIGEKLCMQIDYADLQDLYEVLIERYDYWNSGIIEANKNRRKNMEYCDDTYCLRYPKTLNEFVIEAISQKNCLLDYLEDYIEGKTDILFLRKAKNLGKSYVTVEIRDRVIKQAFLKCNKEPEAEVFNWLNTYERSKVW